MNWYKKAQEDVIRYLGNYRVGGLYFVVFGIRNDFWAYQLSFPDWVNKIKQIQAHSSGKALDWAKKHASAAYLVTRDFPMSGSIIRKEK